MGFAREADLDQAFTPLVACRDYFGYFPAVYRAQTLVPRLLEAEIGLEASILYDDSSLTHSQKERLLLMLASGEGRSDVATAHYEMLRLFGEPEAELDRLLTDYRHCGLAPAEVELLGFALKLGSHSLSVGATDIERLRQYRWPPELIMEAVLLTAWYHFVACISIGLAVSPDFPPATIARSVMATHEEFNAEPDLKAGPYLPAPELVPDQFPAISVFRDLFGFVPNIFRSQAARPKVIGAEAEALRLVLGAEDDLSRRQKEQGGKEYRRLVAAFERIFGATIFFGTDSVRGGARVVHRCRFNFLREAQIWYDRDSLQDSVGEPFENVIVLSDEFYNEILAHPIPTDVDAVKLLASAPAVLDLFMWLVYRCFVAKREEQIPCLATSV
jgi:hypothetical protein